MRIAQLMCSTYLTHIISSSFYTVIKDLVRAKPEWAKKGYMQLSNTISLVSDQFKIRSEWKEILRL